MANRFPLIVDSAALQIKELPANDNLDLSSSGIVNAGVITATAFKGSAQVGAGVGTAGVGTVYLGLTTQFNFIGSGVTITSNYDASSGITTLTFTGGAGGGGGTADSYWVKTTAGIHTLSQVGVGTTNPTESLHVVGNARVTGIVTIGTSSITLDGSTNTITVGSGVTINGDTGTITGTFLGVSTSVNVVNDTTTNATRYILFGSQTEGSDQVRVDSTNLTYNPSTNTLISNNFQGAFSGTASNATRAGIATNVEITDTNTNGTYYVHFGSATSGSDGVDIDSGGLTYNPSTNTIVAGIFSGSGANLTALNASNFSTGTLAIARGGTNSTATPTSGAIAYGTGTAYAFSSAGTSGQFLRSNGASAPTWSDAVIGIATAGGYVGAGITLLDFRGPGVSTVTRSASAGIATVNLITQALVSDDTTTNATRYVVFDDITSGSLSAVSVSSSKLTFNPSSGTLSATVFTSLSDESQKTNVHPIENATELTKQLQGVRFNWVENNQPSVGLIAQDVEKVLPEVVATSENGIKSVNYGSLIGLLVETIKEQQVRIEALEGKLNA